MHTGTGTDRQAHAHTRKHTYTSTLRDIIKAKYWPCSSSEEVEAVLALGISPDHIIFANPDKSFAELSHARR